MFTSSIQIVCGDVVACGTLLYVVQDKVGGELILTRVEDTTSVRHRADVVSSYWAGLINGDLPAQDMVAHCVLIKQYRASNLTRLGALPIRLRKKLGIALKREEAVQKYEESPSVRSNLLASTASSGGRIDVVCYN